jgi:hypothetical protein
VGAISWLFYKFLHYLLNVLVLIANKMDLKNMFFVNLATISFSIGNLYHMVRAIIDSLSYFNIGLTSMVL